MPRALRSRFDVPRFQSTSDAEWNDWRWQLSHRITSLDALAEVVDLSDDETEAFARAADQFRFAITPHYALLMDPRSPDCPIRRQAIAVGDELRIADYEREDPLAEDSTSPVPWLVHRYPDRVLLLITHECAFYCRYCTRRRIVGDHVSPHRDELAAAVAYIREHPMIRDVLISGGDPLAVSDTRLESILRDLRAIPHVEIIRIGTRMPVVMPQRITAELLSILRRYHPLWLNTHFNHPIELAPIETRAAMEAIADAGIPTGNQTVLLRGINDDPAVMKSLVHGLLKVRCRPYYLYSCDLAEGLSHFRVPIARGLAIIEALQGHTTGFAVPTFVIDAPGGGGKVAVMPQTIVRRTRDTVTVRNYLGREYVCHDEPDE